MSLSDMLCDVQLMADDNLPAVRISHDAKGNWCVVVNNEPMIEDEDNA